MSKRILFTFVAGHGHLEPLLPIAAAARDLGNAVTFACSPSMIHPVAAAGFDVVGPLPATSGSTPADDRGASPTTPGPLLAVDREREERDLRERFAGHGARRELTRVLAAQADGDPTSSSVTRPTSEPSSRPSAS